MKTNITLSAALLLSLMTGVPLAIGSASNSFTSSPGKHFRAPKSQNTEKPAVAPAEKAEPAQVSGADDSLFPPTAKPGECYTRVLVPPPSRNVTERILVKEESFRLIEVPAVLEEVTEQVVVRNPSQRQEIIPATYKELEEKVLVAQAYVKQIPVPARYETRTERLLVKPERSYWKKGSGPLSKVDNSTGEIMCYVTEPAVYEEVKRTVQVEAASIRQEQVPAVYKTVKRTVIDQPASIKTIDIPAEYAMVKVTRVKTPASVQRETIPAEYSNVTKQVSEGQTVMGWRRIICETNITPALISDLQTALNAKGYKAGEPNGNLSGETMRALEAYQIASNLPRGGITLQSLDALGVKY